MAGRGLLATSKIVAISIILIVTVYSVCRESLSPTFARILLASLAASFRKQSMQFAFA